MSGRVEDFQQRGCEILGISTDDIATHQRWLLTAPSEGGLGPIAFSLGADPNGTVSQDFGVFVERQRVALRGLFIIDPNGVLQYQVVHSLSVGRSSSEVLRVLDALQSGGLCPGERQTNQPTIDVESSLQPGRIVGQYAMEAELGRGTFGTVFLARDTLLDRQVALKVLRRNEGSSESLLAEARAAAALNHPNICTIHAVDTSNGTPMIVMEFVEGASLATILADGPLPTERATRLARQVAMGMASAHGAGVVHGDLKPGNLIVTSDDTVKIMDFGLARRIISEDVDEDTLPLNVDSQKGISGTLGYLSPERARGEEPSPASDSFSLGLVLYEMLTGDRAISGNNLFETLRYIDEFNASSFVENLPEHLRESMRRTLSQRPADRLTMEQIAAQMA